LRALDFRLILSPLSITPSNGQTGTYLGTEVLAAYYFANKEFKKQSTRDHYDQIVNGVLVPRWGKENCC
jgi:hypothetical protein